MNWFTENSMVPLITGVFLVVVFLGLALHYYDQTMLRIGLAIAILTGLIVGIENWIVTDRESVESTIQGLAIALERNDMPTILNRISSVREDLKERVRKEMNDYQIRSCQIIDFIDFSVDPASQTAESVFVVFASGEQVNGFSGAVHERVKLTFQKEPSSQNWLLTDYAHERAMKETHSF